MKKTFSKIGVMTAMLAITLNIGNVSALQAPETSLIPPNKITNVTQTTPWSSLPSEKIFRMKISAAYGPAPVKFRSINNNHIKVLINGQLSSANNNQITCRLVRDVQIMGTPIKVTYDEVTNTLGQVFIFDFSDADLIINPNTFVQLDVECDESAAAVSYGDQIFAAIPAGKNINYESVIPNIYYNIQTTIYGPVLSND